MPVKSSYVLNRKSSTSSAILTSVASTSTTNNLPPASPLASRQPNQDSIASTTSGSRRPLLPLGSTGSRDTPNPPVLLDHDVKKLETERIDAAFLAAVAASLGKEKLTDAETKTAMAAFVIDK